MMIVHIDNCESGMRLARDIISDEGMLLLRENVELTSSLIKRLKNLSVFFVYVQDIRTEDITVPEAISQETSVVALKAITATFKQVADSPISRTKKTAELHLGKQFGKTMDLLIADLESNKDAMIMLSNIQATDHYLFNHSLNVTIYTMILAISSGYTGEKLRTIGIGTLLHDIGKMSVPLDILVKPGKLTDAEFEEMKKHTMYGFKLLKDEPNIPLLAAHCALQHHERLDGTGYPRGLKSEEIHEFAQLIAITDSYDAMTTNRVYREGMLPHVALDRLFGGSGTMYDPDKLALFRDKVAVYPIGSVVILTNGVTGVVSSINHASPQRPKIRIIKNEVGEDLRTPYEIDMMTNLSASIAKVS